ncbi:putative flavin-containing polyamine oxidase [Lindgomyces ingoldianus]|uniref:Flavin-containing polyamine oxidase n=1 Tax=Lindgomyces ingoldianus TaxID=673940 RepID=A0ACB6QE78_9PLEO|nr:putative flavin-containing polyamine oxidase [Lindgomyces ingoldianus]KAF2464918.1 putative flavin-containing polyamine oxidase [Lindgomyces ingoldianus]
MGLHISLLALFGICFVGAIYTPLDSVVRSYESPCRQTKVAVLGAGVAGVTAAKTLNGNGISDFIIVEYNDYVGGRVLPAKFGKGVDWKPYTIEQGANWVHGTSHNGGPENPIYTLAQKYNLTNHVSDFTSLELFSETGSDGFISTLADFEILYSKVEENAGSIISENIQDRSLRAGLQSQGWYPTSPNMLAAEFYFIEYELAQTADVSSELFAVVSGNSSFGQFSEDNLFILDQRGFSTFIQGEASEILTTNDSRLLLNTEVTNIASDDSSVTITNRDGTCITAEQAIITFSIGVLQTSMYKRFLTFTPFLPDWKLKAIAQMQMGVYTKIFLQFPPEKVFWDRSKEFFLYASRTRGYYPIWQSLDHENFHPGSGILFVTVVGDQSIRIDQQTDSETKAEVLAVLAQMFQVPIPEPLAFYYPRWSTTPWSYGSYSNFPVGMTLEGHQNLRANVGRLWFAGEATSAEYFGFLQGAYFEGREVGERVAARMNGDVEKGRDMVHYEVLKGTTDTCERNRENGGTFDIQEKIVEKSRRRKRRFGRRFGKW